MTAVPAAIVKAFGQLGDRAVAAVLGKSILITLAVFGGLGVGLYFGLARARTYFALDAPWTGTAAGVAAAVLAVLAMWFLFRIAALAVLQFFADEVVVAVETRHFPALAERARPLPLHREMAVAARGLARTIGYNLLALPLAVVLAFTAIGPAVVFLAVNAVLLGRELTDMAWLRHCQDRGAQGRGAEAGNPTSRAERIILGGVIAGMMLVPLLNFIAPVIGVAAGTHLVLRRLEAGAGTR